MSDPQKSSSDPLTVFMLSDAPMGAYHHYCAQLCNALVKRPDIAEVRLISLFEERGANPSCDRQGGISPEERALLDPKVILEVLGPDGRSKVHRYLAFFRNLLRHLREVSRSGRRVIHIQTATGLQLLDTVLPVLYRLMGVPIVRTLHELTAAERIRKPSALELRVGRVQLGLADAVIVHSVETRRTLANPLGGKIPAVIPHGNYLVFRNYMPEGVEDSSPVQEPPAVLFLGIKRHKGIEVFIEALRRLHRRGIPVRAMIAGRVNPGDEDLIEQIRGLPNAEILPGYIPNADLWRTYRRSDAVILPYLRGTTSGAVHLAYAFKRPVIASDLDCFREVVVEGKTGLIVPRGDAQALAEAMIRICANQEERLRMGEEAFRHTQSERFEWNSIARQTYLVYTGLDDRKAAARGKSPQREVLKGR